MKTETICPKGILHKLQSGLKKGVICLGRADIETQKNMNFGKNKTLQNSGVPSPDGHLDC